MLQGDASADGLGAGAGGGFAGRARDREILFRLAFDRDVKREAPPKPSSAAESPRGDHFEGVATDLANNGPSR